MAYPPADPAANKANATVTLTDHPNHHNALANAIIDILDELGLAPKGAAADLTARLTALDALVALKAALASPTFTGTPSAPTAAANTNTTQLATTAYVQTEMADEVTRTDGTYALASSVPVNVKAYGAVGDGTTDDTAAIQAAVNAAQLLNTSVYFPATTAYYKITADIEISRAGTRIIGENPWFTRIRQTTAAEHAFTIIDDPASPQGAEQQHVKFENLKIEGLGIGTSTGYGINAAGDGDWLTLNNVVIRDFERGLHYDGWAQVVLGPQTLIIYNNYNIYALDGISNVNTLTMLGASSARAGVCGIRVGQGFGTTIIGGDHINQPKSLLIQNGGQVTWIGGNFESCTGTDAFIDVELNGVFCGIGNRFLKGTGNDTDNIRINAATGTITVFNPASNGFTNAAVVKKASGSTAVVTILGVHGNLNSNARAINDNGATTYGHGIFPQRADNAVPAAALNYRGLTLMEMGRDTSNTMDALWWYLRDRRSGSAVYTRRSLSQVMKESGTPESAQTADVGTIFTRSDGAAGTALAVKESGTGNTGWANIPTGRTGSTTWDPASVADGAMTSTTVTVTGAAVGDVVAVGFSVAVPAGALLVGSVTATNTVTVTLFNKTGGALDLGSGTLKATVLKHANP